MDKKQINELQKLITEIEGQTIKFDSDNWPQYQQTCVEWGNKVAPFLKTDENRQFNRELDRLRATIHEPFHPSNFSGAPKNNNFNKMLSIAKQRLYQLEHEESLQKVSNPSSKQTTDPTNDNKNWNNKPIGLIGIGIIIVVLGAFALYLIKTHLGLRL
jgi:hypothetical protein